MSCLSIRALALLATLAMVIPSAAQAEESESYFTSHVVGGDAGKATLYDGGGKSGGGLLGNGAWVAEAELLLFKYMRADGVRAGSFNNVPPATTDDVNFAYSASPRITVGYVTNSGLGVRARYWEYDQDGIADFPATGVAMSVNTWNLDFEVYESICINDCWDIELSAGLRYNEFDEQMIDPIPTSFRSNSFEGYGGIVGMEGKRAIRFGSLYARARGAIMQDSEKVVLNTGTVGPPGTSLTTQNAILRDVTQGMTEVAVGWELTRSLRSGAVMDFRVGYEWQNWYNYSTSFAPITSTPPGNPGASFAGPADVGFGGLALSLGLEY